VVDFGLNPAERSCRDRVRALVDDVSGEQMLQLWADMDDIGGDRMFPWSERAQRTICEHGLVGASWPRPWGREAGWGEEYVIEEELGAAGVPATTSHPFVTMMLAHSPELAEEHVPHVLAGTRRFAGALSEPEAGSDLFALRTSARRDGDTYVVNGTKLWTSYAHESQYLCTVVRTEPESTHSRGLSILLVPSDAPGLEIQPVWVIGGWRVNQCFFHDVRVPVANRIGQEHLAAALLSEQLANERTISFGGRQSRLLLSRLVHRLADEERALAEHDQVALGQFVTDLEVERLLNLRAAAMAARGEDPTVAGSMCKVMGSETAQRVAEWLSEVLPSADEAHRWADASCDRLGADAEWFVRGTVTATIAGGTSEVQRNAIAMRGLGLPRGS
jgi:alkylation response protein AidB-like acyl-CoA dehydrogenase